MLHAACWNTGRKKSPFWRHRTTLSACIFAAMAYINNRKKNLLNIDISCTRPHNMVNFGLLTFDVRWRVWGTPTNFNGFRVLAALLHGTVVVGVSQTLRRWTEGTTYIRQGDHHVGHWPTFLVFVFCVSLYIACMCKFVTWWGGPGGIEAYPLGLLHRVFK